MIICYYGHNDYRQKQKLVELKAKFLREIDPDENSFELLDGEKITIKEIKNAVDGGTLFAKKRMTIIKNIFQNKDQQLFTAILELFKTKDDFENIIIFSDTHVYTKKGKALKKDDRALTKAEGALLTFFNSLPYTKELSLPDDKQLADEIKTELQKHQLTISAPALAMLIKFTEKNLWKLFNELNKLISYKSSGQIEIEDVKKIMIPPLEENIFLFVDSLGKKDKPTALRLMEDMMKAGEAPEYLITMLFRQFKLILQLKARQEQRVPTAQAAKEAGVHPFVAPKLYEQSRYFSTEQLKEILDQIILGEYQIKTGTNNIANVLSVLIAKL